MKSGYPVKHFISTFLFFSILFISAGRIDYRPGLVYVAIGFVMALLHYTVLRIDAELLNERLRPGKGSRKWDKIILGLLSLTMISMYVIAGLDSGRYHWSPPFHWTIHLLGGILTAFGQLLFLIAQSQNKFFSSTVRIQTDRGHTVYDKGPYGVVRHPGYLGSMVQLAGFPLLFGSVWSLIPIGVAILLLVVRTNLEDATLKNELQGYLDYSAKTRHKAIPYVW